MVFLGLEWAIIDSCHVRFDGWLIGCHAALIWSFPICIRKSLPNMCCGPLTSRLNHFERPCVLFTLSLSLSPPVFLSVCLSFSLCRTQSYTHRLCITDVQVTQKKWNGECVGRKSGFTVRHHIRKHTHFQQRTSHSHVHMLVRTEQTHTQSHTYSG